MKEPKKRYKVMVAGFFRNLAKGSILTYSKAADCYFRDDYPCSFKKEDIEEQPRHLLEPLSADGLTWEEIKGNDHQYYYKGKEKWLDHIGWFSIEYINLFRLKPQPEYIPVPESIELLQGIILNGKRALTILSSDGLPILRERNHQQKPRSKKIDPTPLTELEDGQIYFDNAAVDIYSIFSYCIYCKKGDAMYYFPSKNDYRVLCMEGPRLEGPKLENFRKVI